MHLNCFAKALKPYLHILLMYKTHTEQMSENLINVIKVAFSFWPQEIENIEIHLSEVHQNVIH